MRNKITFTYRGYVVAVVHNDVADKAEAIRIADMTVAGHYDSVRLERNS